MRASKLDAVPPRHGDWGPAYLIQGPSSDIGLLTLRPGDAMDNHLHRHCDESFIVVSGRASLWVDCAQEYALAPGDVYRCEPGEMHYFVNDGDEVFTMVFVKSPSSPGDTVVVAWEPGQPPPHTAEPAMSAGFGEAG
jgi:mannose-6-phosphate isomerase-like protein (cupin superfamily)